MDLLVAMGSQPLDFDFLSPFLDQSLSSSYFLLFHDIEQSPMTMEGALSLAGLFIQFISRALFAPDPERQTFSGDWTGGKEYLL